MTRQGRARGWTPRRVTTILGQPAYTGHVVGNRYRKGQRLPAPWWMWSPEPAHPALIDADTFWSAHARLEDVLGGVEQLLRDNRDTEANTA